MGDEVRISIMDAADRAFAQFGFKKTSVEDIARAAGIGKGTIYLYFDSKDALFEVCVRRKRDESLSSIVSASAKARSSEEKLRAFVIAKLSQPLRYHAAFDLQLAPLLDLTERTLRMLPEQEDREAIVLEQILAAGHEDGTFEVTDARVVARGIVNLIGGLSLRNVVSGPQAAQQQADLSSLELIIRGLLRSPTRR